MGKWDKLSAKVSDKISSFVGTWTFVFLYTLSMGIWIGLHLLGILHIDGPDFIKWNLWLSYFAGTQASIVLMSSERQSELDRKKMRNLLQQVDMLEEILNEFLTEEEQKKEPKNDKRKKQRKKQRKK